jgi:hypothetical protein
MVPLGSEGRATGFREIQMSFALGCECNSTPQRVMYRVARRVEIPITGIQAMSRQLRCLREKHAQL